MNCSSRDYKAGERENEWGTRITYFSFRRPRLYTLPEPFHDFVGWVAAHRVSRSSNNVARNSLSSVIRVLHPVIDINFRHSTDQQFQLALVKDVDEFLRNKLVEAGHEGLELLGDTSFDSVGGHETARDQRVFI